MGAGKKVPWMVLAHWGLLVQVSFNVPLMSQGNEMMKFNA